MSTQGTSPQSNNVQVPQTQRQNIAQTQSPTTNTGTYQQSPVALQQHSPLLQPPVLVSQAAPTQQSQPQFVQPRATQPMGQQRQPSPFKQGFNPASKSFIPPAEAQLKAVPNTPEKKIPKSMVDKVL